MKLLVHEPQTAALTEFLTRRGASLATSAVAVVEVLRAVRIAEPGPAGAQRARRRFDETILVEVTRELLDDAASYTSVRVRALDAIHLASALQLGTNQMLVYDRRLADAAAAAGLDVLSPGA